LLDIDQNQQY